MPTKEREASMCYFPQALKFHGARWGPEKHGDSLNGSFEPVHPKGNQPRIFIGRTDDEAEAPIL